MLYWLTRALTALVILVFAAGVLALCTGSHFFRAYATHADTQVGALALLTTLSQSLASILGIAIAVLFITIQTTSRTTFAHALRELHSGKAIATLLLLFLVVLCGDILSIAWLRIIVAGPYFWILDFNLLSSLCVLLLIGPVVLLQVENINPLAVARKLCAKVTPGRVWEYQFVHIEPDVNVPGQYKYSLNTLGGQHGLLDPLGAIHEVIMTAVNSHDRVLLSGLNRILLRRIARITGASLAISRSTEGRWYWQLWTGMCSIFRLPANPEDQLAVTLHVMHYMVRRAHNLRSEWGSTDMIRQQYLMNIHDLIVVLMARRGRGQVIDVCIAACLHIELDYTNVERPANKAEVLTQFFFLAAALSGKGYTEEAKYLIEILAFVAQRTSRINWRQMGSLIGALPDSLKSTFHATLSIAKANTAWFPDIPDPWSNRRVLYELPRLPLGESSGALR